MKDNETKSILAKVYSLQFQDETIPRTFEGLSSLLTHYDDFELESKVGALESQGLVEVDENNLVKLTEKGRKMITVVMTGGAFDIIHPGHIETLERAKSLGDVLVVSVARNATFERNKHRKPMHDEKLRRHLVHSIKDVDAAVLGSETDIFETVKLLKPDIIALGYDQSHSETTIRNEIQRKGLDAKVVRLESAVPTIKTSKIIKENNESLRDI